MKTIKFLFITGLLLTACKDGASPPASTVASTQQSTRQAQAVTAQPVVARARGPAKIARGAKLFAQNCASCHGHQAEGAPQWSTPAADGKYPPPPLNGTAHTWHHPTTVLKRTIREGTSKLGGNMPPWGDKLSDEEIEAIIAWFQSLWPDEIYEAWVRIDMQSH